MGCAHFMLSPRPSPTRHAGVVQVAFPRPFRWVNPPSWPARSPTIARRLHGRGSTGRRASRSTSPRVRAVLSAGRSTPCRARSVTRLVLDQGHLQGGGDELQGRDHPGLERPGRGAPDARDLGLFRAMAGRVPVIRQSIANPVRVMGAGAGEAELDGRRGRADEGRRAERSSADSGPPPPDTAGDVRTPTRPIPVGRPGSQGSHPVGERRREVDFGAMILSPRIIGPGSRIRRRGPGVPGAGGQRPTILGDRPLVTAPPAQNHAPLCRADVNVLVGLPGFGTAAAPFRTRGHSPARPRPGPVA